MSWESGVYELLSASLMRPFILAAGALIILRVFRVEHPASKHAVWTAVLLGMLVLPFASVVGPHVEFEALPEGTLSGGNGGVLAMIGHQRKISEEYVNKSHAVSENSAKPGGKAGVAAARDQVSIPEEGVPSDSRSVSIKVIVAWCYLAGFLLSSAYRFTGWVLLRRLLSRSRAVVFARLRESNDIVVPFAVGIWRPVVVLPAGWRDWSKETRRAILTHEFAHVRRRDTWVLTLSRWLKCIFWFHPLAWYVARKTSELAEMACDAAALRRVRDAAQYSQILVDFAGSVHRHGYRAAIPGLAMAGPSPLGNRIDQVFALWNGKQRRLSRPVAVLLLFGLPLLGAAATVRLTEPASFPLVQAKSFVSAAWQAVTPNVVTPMPLANFAMSFFSTEPVGPPELVLPPQSTSGPREFLDQYCVSCHNKAARVAGLTLDERDLTQVRKDGLIWEKVLRKLETGMEPRLGAPKPEAAAIRRFTQWLEGELDRNAPVFMPPPGPHRLNRTEYANAIRDILGLEVNPALFLPGDDSTRGFDNIASALEFNPAAGDSYRAAADKITDLALNSPSRRLVFTCRPNTADEVPSCVRRITTELTTRAFRGQASEEDISKLLSYYSVGQTFATGFSTYDFDRGIRNVLRSILADRKFLYRTEAVPPGVAAGQSYRISDLELASRLSFFLWSTSPDDQLIDLANRGQLRDPVVLERETRRMLKDPRAEALTVNFAAQWLNLRGLQVVDFPSSYPNFDEPLREAMRREVEMLFSSIVREDRNILDLVTADYTFLNERLARHYGIPNVSGSEFRRVTLNPTFDARRGILGKAAFLTVTSRPERTSLTTRAIWILSRLLGTYPPDPPPNVPPLARVLTAPMREVMEQHNFIAACKTCHRLMDPLGIALDNFDRSGMWRTQDFGKTIDPSTELYDGTKLSGPADVRNAIIARSDLFFVTVTDKLMTYGLGRGTEWQDMPLIRSIARDAARDNNRFSAFVVGIVKSAPFQMNGMN